MLLDLSAALNTVDRSILLQRLEDAVVHIVHVNEESSSHTKVSYGVPQGSVLGHYTLYIIQASLRNYY